MKKVVIYIEGDGQFTLCCETPAGATSEVRPYVEKMPDTQAPDGLHGIAYELTVTGASVHIKLKPVGELDRRAAAMKAATEPEPEGLGMRDCPRCGKFGYSWHSKREIYQCPRCGYPPAEPKHKYPHCGNVAQWADGGFVGGLLQTIWVCRECRASSPRRPNATAEEAYDVWWEPFRLRRPPEQQDLAENAISLAPHEAYCEEGFPVVYNNTPYGLAVDTTTTKDSRTPHIEIKLSDDEKAAAPQEPEHKCPYCGGRVKSDADEVCGAWAQRWYCITAGCKAVSPERPTADQAYVAWWWPFKERGRLRGIVDGAYKG